MTISSPLFAGHFKLWFKEPVLNTQSKAAEKRYASVFHFLDGQKPNEGPVLRLEIDGRSTPANVSVNSRNTLSFVSKAISWNEFHLFSIGNANGIDIICQDKYDSQVKQRLKEFKSHKGGEFDITSFGPRIRQLPGSFPSSDGIPKKASALRAYYKADSQGLSKN